MSRDFYQRVGVYYWVPPDGYTSEQAFGLAAARIAEIGGRNMHALFNARANAYQSLTQLAMRASVKSGFDHPGIGVYLLTTYDATTTPGNPTEKAFLNPNFYTASNTAALEREYREFTFYLYQTYHGTGKRFIISNWEGDNEIYCGSTYGYAKDASFRNSCNMAYPSLHLGQQYGSVPNPYAALGAMQLWFAARQRGVAQGRLDAANAGYSGVEVYHAPEFVSVNILRNSPCRLEDGFCAPGEPTKSLLYDAIPYLDFDFVSYSAYNSTNLTSPDESPNSAKARLVNDLDTIQSVISSRNIIIGEFGHGSLGSFGSYPSEVVGRTNDVLDTALDWGVPYVFNWELFDTGIWGVYHMDGVTLQPLGDQVFRQRFQASRWEQVAGTLKQVSVGSAEHIWGVTEGGQIYRWTAGGWQGVGGWLKQISISAAGAVWGVNSWNNIYRWTGVTWEQMPGSLEQVSVVNDSNVWGVMSNYIFHWTGLGWEGIPGLLADLSAAYDGSVWGVNAGGSVYFWDGSIWELAPGILRQISVGRAGSVWGASPADDVYKWNPSINNWEPIAGKQLKQVSVGHDGTVWGVDGNGSIWRYRL